jgi:group I intron endonuclease
MNSGIYQILNKINGKKYVGSSKDIRYRWNQSHRPQLRSGNHCNRHLQSAWNKYGEENFEFKKLESCDEKILLEREGYWIEKTKSWERENGYNLTRIVDGKQVLSEETISKRTEAVKLKDYWTTGTNAEIIECYKNGKSKNQIAIDLGITRSAVYSCLEQNGLHENTGAGSEIKLTNEVREQVPDLREHGKTWAEIVEQVPVSATQLRRANAITPDDQYKTNKLNRKYYRTITPDVIKKAQYLRRTTGMKWKDIAKECGVSREWLSNSGACENQTRKDFSKTKRSKAFKDEVVNMMLNGEKTKIVSDKTNVPESTIRLWLKKHENKKSNFI